MGIALELFGLPALISAIVALAVVLLLGRFPPAAIAARYAFAVALACGFLVGHVALRSWPELAPKQHEQWLPHLALAAAFTGAISLAGGISRIERWLLHLALAFAAAWLLTPTWQNLQPARPVWIGILTAYFFLTTALLDPLPERLDHKIFPVLLTLAAAGVFVLVAAFGSFTYAQLGGLATAALLGSCGGVCFPQHATMARGAIAPFVIVVGGVAFVACVYPEQPLYPLLAALAAPLVLWLFTFGPLSRLRGIAAGAAQAAAVVVALALVGAGLSIFD